MRALDPPRLLLQIFNYALFMAVVWYFSIYPPHRRLDENEAVVTLAFGHTTKRISECKTLSQSELQELAPNMRASVECPRGRSPLTAELILDDAVAARIYREAPGLYNDQGIDVYRDITTSAGDHLLSMWLNDDANTEGPTYRFERSIELRPAQRLVVSFNASKGGFVLK